MKNGCTCDTESGAVQEAGGVTKEELTVLRTKIDPLNIYGTRQR
jgi:hypothetical protein